eukprot:1083815-Rhodomonas_salina.1
MVIGRSVGPRDARARARVSQTCPIDPIRHLVKHRLLNLVVNGNEAAIQLLAPCVGHVPSHGSIMWRIIGSVLVPTTSAREGEGGGVVSDTLHGLTTACLLYTSDAADDM